MMLRTMMPRTRLEWVEKLAGAGMWIAIGASSYVDSTRPEWRWTWAAAGCIMTLAVVSAVAGIPRRLAGRRMVLRKGSGRGQDEGSGLSGRGRDDDGGPADEAVHRRHALAVVSRLMPRSAGRRWLAEAESLLAEVPAARRGAAARSYLLSAPRLAVMMWVRAVLRRAQPGPRRPG